MYQQQHESMNITRYQTKKSIAQGMLDISLLTANISQLKYVLQVGHKHEFYTLLIMLLSVVIFLQASPSCHMFSYALVLNYYFFFADEHGRVKLVNELIKRL